MATTGTTTGAAVPTAPTGTGLPPALPPGFDTPTTTGGGTTPATTTPPATAATSTTFTPATNTVGGGYTQIPAPPGSCSTPPPTPLQGGGAPAKDPAQVAGAAGAGAPGKDPIQGGGANAGTLGPILSQLSGILGQLTSAVGGASGGGAPGKTPVQGGGTTPPAPTTPPASGVAGAAGGGATPAPSTVAGANGAAGANAAQGAAQVQGGGTTAPQDMSAIVAALNGLVEVLQNLVKALGGVVAGGPTQAPPGKDAPSKGDVKGDNGPGQLPTQSPIQAPPKGDVKGDNGPGQKPPVTPPPNIHPPAPPTKVAGDNGGPVQQTPTQAPPKVEPPKVGGQNGGPIQQVPTQAPPKVEPPKVGGQNGGPVQQTPVQTPVQTPPAKVDGANGGPVQQTPVQAPPKPVVVKGNVVLDNDDERWSAKLVAAGGKAENSVELWGDPHVVVTTDGKAEKFDIGFGDGKVTLFDGTVISWDTFAKGAKLEGQRPGANDDVSHILRNFKVNSAGSEFDRSVTTRDRDGNKGDQMGLTTALTDAHLKEFAIALRTMQGDWKAPLKNGTWVSPAYQKPTQTPGQTPAQV